MGRRMVRSDRIGKLRNIRDDERIIRKKPYHNLTVPVFAELLEDIFGYLKGYMHCKIAFICDTDEAKFAGYATFLNYVDIHVNTDIRTPFAHSVMYRISPLIEANTPNDMEIMILFDSHYADAYNDAQNADVTYNLNDRTSYQIMSEIMYVLEDMCNAQSSSLNDIAQACRVNYNVRLYSVSPGGIFKNLEGNTTISMTDAVYNAKELVYIMRPDANLNLNCRLLEDLICSFTPDDFYAYSFGSVSVPAPEASLLTIYELVYTYEECFTRRVEAMIDFLEDEDLSDYNNWYGVCDISYKILGTGPDGWMIGVLGYGSKVKPLYD